MQEVLTQFSQMLTRPLVRRSFKKSVQAAESLRIVVGSSGVFQEGWIPTEVWFLNLLQERDWLAAFGGRPLDAILAEHVWEHLTEDEGLQAARNCFRHVRSGGYVRIAVPDGYHPGKDYLEWVAPGGTGPGSGDHKVLYTHKTLTALFQRAGFKTRLLEYFDEEGAFHAETWDVSRGKILRSKAFDERNADGTLRYTSVILDAVKP